MNPGRQNCRVTFRRRQKVAGNPRERADWQDLLSVWAEYRRATGREDVQGGRPTDVEEGTLTVRFPGLASGVTIGDRVMVEGRERAVTSVATPDRRAGTREIAVTTDLTT